MNSDNTLSPHGEKRKSTERVEVKITHIEGVIAGSDHQVKKWARHLEDDGLLVIDPDDDGWGPPTFSLNNELFVQLHWFANGDRAVLSRVIEDLDLTAFDD